MGVLTSSLLALCAASAVPDVPFENGFPVTSKDRIYKLSEVKRGQRGVGYTVFAADKAERFEFEVLGVMRAMLGPGQDVVLVKLIGKKIEFTGVISGMSGSPSYIDGRLLGAVSYRFGSFSREAIAGITPIENMIAIYEGGEVQPAAPVRTGGRRQPIHVSDFRGRALPALTLPTADAMPAGTDLRPIAAPLSISGMDPNVAATLSKQLERVGFVAVTSAASNAAPSDNKKSSAGAVAAAPIAPASPIAALLTRGDITLAAIGTVTMVDGNRVYGFGHPFMGWGHVKFPMATAAIINTLASEAGSYKQGAPALTVGAITHDRLTAIAGDIGDVAPMVPVKIVVQSANERRSSPGLVTNVEVVDDPVWFPVMADNVISSAGGSRLGFEAGGTVDYETDIVIGDHTLTIKDSITGPPPLRIAAYASRDVATTASILLRNDFEKAKLKRIDVRMRIRPEVLEEEIVEVSPLLVDARPGSKVPITVTLRPFRGPDETVTLSVPVPEDATGTIEIAVGGGLEIDRRDGNVKGGIVPQSLEDLLGVLAERRHGRALYARVYMMRKGLRDGAELYAALPVSQRAVLGAQTHAGLSAMDKSFGPEVSISRPRVVMGERAVTVTVLPR